MDLLTKILINKYKNQGGGSGGSEMNLFIQNDQPEGYDGIWIKSTSFTYSNIAEVPDKNSLVASSINIVKGTRYEIILFNSDIQNGATYTFDALYFTDANNEIIYDVPTYYGNGTQWVDITRVSVQEYEYLQGQGTINVGYKLKPTNKIEIKYANTDYYQSWASIIQDSSSTNKFLLQYVEPTQAYVIINSTTKYIPTTGGAYAFHTATIDFSTGDITIDNVDDVVAPLPNINTANLVVINGKKFKLSYLKIWEGDTLVRNYVPVKDENEVACLYDKINRDYYHDNGSAVYTLGPAI